MNHHLTTGRQLFPCLRKCQAKLRSKMAGPRVKEYLGDTRMVCTGFEDSPARISAEGTMRKTVLGSGSSKTIGLSLSGLGCGVGIIWVEWGFRVPSTTSLQRV